MISYFENAYLNKVAKINYILLAVYLAISVTAHATAYRLVLVYNAPVISTGFIYMAAFVLIDVFASFNSRRLIVWIILIAALFNLFFITYTNIISHMPYPAYLQNVDSYKEVFSPIIILYIANLCGTLIASMLDLFIFYYLYFNRRIGFFLASCCSSLITLVGYTYVTDFIGFRYSYPEHFSELTFVNLLTNLITLIFYSILGQILVISIQRYLKKSG